MSHILEQSILCIGNHNTKAWGEKVLDLFPEQQVRMTGAVSAGTRVLINKFKEVNSQLTWVGNGR